METVIWPRFGSVRVRMHRFEFRPLCSINYLLKQVLYICALELHKGQFQ